MGKGLSDLCSDTVIYSFKYLISLPTEVNRNNVFPFLHFVWIICQKHMMVYFVWFFFMNICSVISKVNNTLEIGYTVSSKYLYSSAEYRIGLDSHLLICSLHMDSSSLCNSTSNIMHLNGYSVRAYSIFQKKGSGCSLQKNKKVKMWF